MSEYRPDKIESYWQNIWSEKDSFKIEGKSIFLNPKQGKSIDPFLESFT